MQVAKSPAFGRGTIDLIRDMTKRNRLWGAERIRGELLKLGIRVAKRTIQRHMRGLRTKRGARRATPRLPTGRVIHGIYDGREKWPTRAAMRS